MEVQGSDRWSLATVAMGVNLMTVFVAPFGPSHEPR